MTETLEDLRRHARSLENQIDGKLVALNKLAAGSTNIHESLMDCSRQKIFDTLSSELEGTIGKLLQFNDQMCERINSNQNNREYVVNHSNPTTLQHTVQRHREILRDFTAEYHRVHGNIRSQLDREILLGDGNQDSCVLNNRVKACDFYLKEHDHITSCDRLLDEQISIAISTKDNVSNQRFTLRDINRKVNALAKRYPVISSFMQKIQTKKRKDTIILAAVISLCFIFMFLYSSAS